jgi:hypothetical protein
VFLANMCIVNLFQLWEDHYRGRLASALDVQKNDLKVAVFGDLRVLRNAIIHSLGIATPQVAKCEVLRWFKPGDPIEPTKEQMRSMTDVIYAYVDSLPANKKVSHPATAPIPIEWARAESSPRSIAVLLPGRGRTC